MHTFVVSEKDTSAAWAAACRALDTKANTRRDGFHTVVRIEDATTDDLAFRAELDRVRAASKCKHPVETVANTVFPAQLAATARDPEALVRRYRAMYPQLQRMDPGNRSGTYFGRIVAYPGADGPVDQLSTLITRLRSQTARSGALSAAYEVDIAHPEDEEAGSPVASAAVPVHVAGTDNSVRGFPCLSQCSFQLDRDGALHMVAYYRSHYMLDRAYGNYLGLGRLQAYLAEQVGLTRGTLTVLAGHAQIEDGISRIRPLIQGMDHLVAA